MEKLKLSLLCFSVFLSCVVPVLAAESEYIFERAGMVVWCSRSPSSGSCIASTERTYQYNPSEREAILTRTARARAILRNNPELLSDQVKRSRNAVEFLNAIDQLGPTTCSFIDEYRQRLANDATALSCAPTARTDSPPPARSKGSP
jgi:hypothetical protein